MIPRLSVLNNWKNRWPSYAIRRITREVPWRRGNNRNLVLIMLSLGQR